MAESEGKLAFKAIMDGHKATAYRNIFRESVGFAAAELVSMGVSLGVVAVADDLVPDFIKHAKKFVAKHCIEPFQDTIEWGLGKACRLRDCQVDYSKSRSERAEDYAHFVVIFGTAFLPSLIAKLGTRMGMNRLMGVTHEPKAGNWIQRNILPSKHDLCTMARDEGVHLGAIALMNTAFSHQTDWALNKTESVLQKQMGWSEEKAKRVAEMFVIWELPNFLGLASGLHYIYGHHMNKIPSASQVEKLALQDASHLTLGI